MITVGLRSGGWRIGRGEEQLQQLVQALHDMCHHAGSQVASASRLQHVRESSREFRKRAKATGWGSWPPGTHGLHYGSVRRGLVGAVRFEVPLAVRPGHTSTGHGAADHLRSVVRDALERSGPLVLGWAMLLAMQFHSLVSIMRFAGTMVVEAREITYGPEGGERKAIKVFGAIGVSATRPDRATGAGGAEPPDPPLADGLSFAGTGSAAPRLISPIFFGEVGTALVKHTAASQARRGGRGRRSTPATGVSHAGQWLHGRKEERLRAPMIGAGMTFLLKAIEFETRRKKDEATRRDELGACPNPSPPSNQGQRP